MQTKEEKFCFPIYKNGINEHMQELQELILSGKRIQIELDRKNGILRIFELHLKRYELKKE